MSMGYDSDYHEGYNDGQQSKQNEVDKLIAILGQVTKACFHIKDGTIREHCKEYDKGWRDCAISISHFVELKLKNYKENDI